MSRGNPAPIINGMKQCRGKHGCGKLLPLPMFDKQQEQWYLPNCRECRSKQNTEYLRKRRTMKKCSEKSGCGDWLELSEFRVREGKPYSICKACETINANVYRAKEPSEPDPRDNVPKLPWPAIHSKPKYFMAGL